MSTGGGGGRKNGGGGRGGSGGGDASRSSNTNPRGSGRNGSNNNRSNVNRNNSRRGGGNNSNNSNNNHANRGQRTRNGVGAEGGGDGLAKPQLRDEDILIAFMPYLKGNHTVATRIHEDYQTSNDQHSFLRAARTFLEAQTAPLSTMDALNGNDANRPDPPGNIQTPQPGAGTPQRRQFREPDVNSMEQGVSGMSIASGKDCIQVSAASATNPSTAFPGESIWGANIAPPQQTTTTTNSTPTPSPITPPRSSSHHHANNNRSIPTSPWGNVTHQRSPNHGNSGHPNPVLTKQVISSSSQPHQQIPSPPTNHPSSTTILEPQIRSSSQPALPQALPNQPSSIATNTATKPATTGPPRKEPYQPKRVWTHHDEQPGRIFVNGVSGEDASLVLPLGPRQELTANWSLPIAYLRNRTPHIDPTNASLDKALRGLTVGLFRRGCTENGQQASIISKEISSYDYYHDPASQSIRGKCPFFSPRTPGNVLFRMYWESKPLHTLAMGPTLRVRVVEQDFENSIRFILSNFKGRKSNPTSLSSLHSLSTVLETPLRRRHDSSVARSVWGCIQEARKVIEACYQEYVKTSSKMSNLEEKVDELRKQAEEESSSKADVENTVATSTPDDSAPKNGGDTVKSACEVALQEKTRALMSGRASCERKWRDSQLSFASILKTVLSNSSMNSLLRRDLITRMRIEYELWCPLSEEFAVPRENAETWYECINDLPQSISPDHFRVFQQARVKMQMRTLGFDVNTMSLEDTLFPSDRNNPTQRTMDPGAVGVFNTMSAAMGNYYQELFIDEEMVVRKRELIRQRTQKDVQDCGAFPPGTEVVIFGSSANGFGSPKSDLDMCLHLPDGAQLNVEDGSGPAAMAQLAAHFEKSGMKDVDPARLSARIPIIMYNCPDPLANTSEGDEELIECDISMHNPLAVLNTSLLRSYAEITPVTRVLASIIKRWAKARDINSPARHTLSSYGYIVMLLHFLTYHKRTGNGLVSPVARPEGNSEVRSHQAKQETPLLPNLQWMQPAWPQMPQGTPYSELPSLPRNMMKHPMKDTSVNTYFYKPASQNEKQVLQMLFPGQDLSLAILLASFFRYFAYEFDYKRHVVSLHSTASRGIVEREVKAELDGWRNYSAALAIEDPFELDYDIAHVLRGGYYHRIRREFALAYTKIADAASGRPNSWNKGDLRASDGKDLIDWICEAVANERENQTSVS